MEMNQNETKSGNQNERTMAILAHILGLFTSFVAPLIFYLVLNEQPYAKEQAKESLNFQITVIIGYLIATFLTFIVIGVFVFFVLAILNIVFCVIAAIAASKGDNYRYPISIRLIN